MVECLFLGGRIKIVLGDGSACVEETVCDKEARDTPFGYAIDGFTSLLVSLCSTQPDIIKHDGFEESLQSALDAIENNLGED